MKWTKLGQIFTPDGIFAQSPQALVCNDLGFVRVFYSTRLQDSSGKWLSHPRWVEFDKDFKNVLDASGGTVVELGLPGHFDEHGIFPLNVFNFNGLILGYTTGWSRRKSVSIETSIGIVVSEDAGRSFTKTYGHGPILTASPNEPFLVGDAFVKRFDDTFHMWYIYGTKWIDGDQPERVYKIGHATSIDAINWRRDGGSQIISDVWGEDECQALPTVIKIGDTYHMYFCYRRATDFRTNKERGYRLGYAYSKNLWDWTRDDKAGGMELSEAGWDSEMMCYPHLFEFQNKVYMLYNGNEFGKRGFGLAVLESDK